MMYLLIFLHILVCIAMIVIVLLQSGKGAEMGASFGTGGSQSVFGASGGTTFMSKLTTGAAIIFMLTSLTLAYESSNASNSSIMSSRAAQKAAPAKSAAPAATPGQPQTAAPAKPATSQGAPAPAAPAAPVKK